VRKFLLLGCVLMLALVPATVAEAAAHSALPSVVANDNRTPAGRLSGNTLDLQLEARVARWYPEAEGGAYRDVWVFGETGHSPQAPGPLIRVTPGTEIHVTVRNSLPLLIKVYGLHRHPGDPDDTLSIPPGESREVKFSTGEPGTYFYWAAVSGHMLDTRDDAETMLSGAYIVDPPGAQPDDRIFVLGLWGHNILAPDGQEIAFINGKAWPYAERVTYSIGETIHWRVINPTIFAHGMRLHGFFFDVDAVGDNEHYERFSSEMRPKANTQFIDTGHVYDMTWTPERSGNWLFHCHMVAHMTPPECIHPPSAAPASYTPGHDADSMGGLILGITILPIKGSAPPPPPAATAVRKLQLVISENPKKIPLYTLEVKDPAVPPPASAAASSDQPPVWVGPPLILTRDETTDIEVKNQSTQPTTIHWHGMEIESYYDGVAGWSGSTDHPSPEIPPGGSFVARMTPPRAGTFIYHTHWHDASQLLNAMYGPLIVLEPGQKYDPDHDRTFIFGVGNYAPFGYLMLINGNPQPDLVGVQAGVKYHLRLINITDNVSDMRVRLTFNDAATQWTIVAKDGAALPPAQLNSSAAEMWLTVGETYDVEYGAASPGVANLTAWSASYPVPITVPLKFTASK
jgi:manganese oxidase